MTPMAAGRDGEWGTPEMRRFLEQALSEEGAAGEATRSTTVSAEDRGRRRVTARRLQLAEQSGPSLVLRPGPPRPGEDDDG